MVPRLSDLFYIQIEQLLQGFPRKQEMLAGIDILLMPRIIMERCIRSEGRIYQSRLQIKLLCQREPACHLRIIFL